MKVSIEHWYCWDSGKKMEDVPDLSFLPSRARRRLSKLSRIILEVGHHLCKKSPIDDVIFASRYGELGRQLDITRGLIDENEVSPSLFSSSVFNTPVALLSLHEGIKGKTRAIYGGENSLIRGLLQTILSIKSSDTERILFLFGDEIIPEIYEESQGTYKKSAAIGLVLGSEQENALLTIELLNENDGPTGICQPGESAIEHLADWMELGSSPLVFADSGYSLVFSKGRQ